MFEPRGARRLIDTFTVCEYIWTTPLGISGVSSVPSRFPMATLTPYSPQPLASSSRSPSPAPGYITYSKTEADFPDSAPDHDTALLTGRGLKRSSSPTPSEKIELREFEGTTRKFFRKESWKNRSFLSK